MSGIILLILFLKENLPVPLAVGNYWVYKHIFYNYDWNIDSLIEDSSYERVTVVKKINKIKGKKVNGYLIKGGPLEGIYFYEDDFLWFYSQDEKIFIKLFPVYPQYIDEWYMFKTAEKTEDLDEDGIPDSSGVISIARIVEKKENIYKVLIWEYRNSEWHSKTKEWFDGTFPAWGWLTVEMGKGIIEYEVPVRRGEGDRWIIRRYRIKD